MRIARTIRPHVLAGLAILISLGVARAGEPIDVYGGTIKHKLLLESYAQATKVADSNDNPGNQVARLAERSLTVELRPDLHFASDILDLRIRPRGRGQENQVVSGGVTGRDWTTEAYVNEWSVRFTPTDSLAISAGREVLLWGPAQSFSPSNPFYTNNGRSNPYLELGGKDLFKGVYFPASGWTFSYIDNFGKGRDEPPPLESFHHTRVLKLDHTGEQAYWSVNYAFIEGTPARIGLLAQRTISDALLTYAEGGYSRYRTQYRPESDGSGGSRLAPPSGGGLSGLGVLGLAYTLQAGPTVSFEYVYNNQGWTDSEASDYQLLTQAAAQQLAAGGPLTGSAMQQLARGVQPGSPLLRRHYLFVQYLHQNLMKNLNLVVRLTRNIDDNGMRGGPILEWRVGNRFKLFALGVFATGGAHTEFGRYVVRQGFVGLETNF